MERKIEKASTTEATARARAQKAESQAGWTRVEADLTTATPGWPRTLAIVQDAAFYLYQRGAVDYAR